MNVLVLGGNGHVGKQIVEQLPKSIRVFTFGRGKGAKNHYQGDLKDVDSLTTAMENIDLVINLIGLSPIRNISYDKYFQAHVVGVRNILAAAPENIRIIHISAIGANSRSDINYLQTKGIAEDILKKSKHEVLIVRPSLIIGEGSELLRMFKLMSFFKFVPIPRITSLVQPVNTADFAKSIGQMLQFETDATIEIGGKDIYQIHELLGMVVNSFKAKPIKIPLFVFRVLFMLIPLKKYWFPVNPQLLQLFDLDNVVKENVKIVGGELKI